jgi:hypothetical protein
MSKPLQQPKTCSIKTYQKVKHLHVLQDTNTIIVTKKINHKKKIKTFVSDCKEISAPN